MVFVYKGKAPVTAFVGIVSTFNDAVAFGVLGNDVVLGEGDTEACVALWGNANEGPGEVVHDVTMMGGWRYVLVFDLGIGRGGCLDAVGNFYLDAGGGGVEMGDRGVLAEVEAAGVRVGNTEVGFRKGGSTMEGWAAGQGDSMGHFVGGSEEKRRLRL